jgi:hypothetical protein
MAAVGRVHELAREKRSALLCFEADAHMCHRSTLARRILETFGDVRVVNLRARQGVAPTAPAGHLPDPGEE